MLIDRRLGKCGDSDRRFATFYFSNSSLVCLISPYLSWRLLLPKHKLFTDVSNLVSSTIKSHFKDKNTHKNA